MGRSTINMDFSNKASVARLINDCLSGDRKSQQFLYSSLYSKMLVVCRRYSNTNEGAKDLLHDGFVKVFQNLEKFKNEGSLEGWVRRIMVNNALDDIKQTGKVYLLSDETYFENLLSEKEELNFTKDFIKEKAEIILWLIQKIPKRSRAVFNLYAIDNYTHDEIADKLGISAGTSKSNYARSKQKLQELYNEYINEKSK